ncbi:MAG: nuclear transport factor 2 family protein [Reyranellales bacterium]
MTNIKTFVEQYISVWNEPDAERRRAIIRALWQPDARHLARTLEAEGHAGIETRVVNAYDKWVKEKGCTFRLRDGVDGHHDTIKLRWEMLPAGGGEVISIGFDFLVMGEDGRIRTGYQFIEA